MKDCKKRSMNMKEISKRMQIVKAKVLSSTSSAILESLEDLEIAVESSMHTFQMQIDELMS